MKTILAGLGSLVLALSLSHSALAQEQVAPPEQAPQVVVAGVPYVYVFTPGLGWGWSAPAWGRGGYAYRGWAGHPWRGPAWRGRVAYPHAVGRGGYHYYGHRR
jgi:hypothetical protein